MNDEYELFELLGQGGMGRVHRARHKTSGRLVAIKLLHDHLYDDHEARERFMREIRTCLKLSHPAIVKILDAGTVQGKSYYTMEYLGEAVTLTALLKDDGPLELDLALDATRALLDALAYCHGLDVLHRDIKPSNLMMGPGDRVTLMDFGLVGVADGFSLTATGGAIGTPTHWSPEICRGGKFTPAADLWAIGVVLYQMVAGAAPFRGTSIAEVMDAVIERVPPPLTKLRPGLPPAIDELMHRFLSKEPEDRFPSAEAALAGIEEWTVRQDASLKLDATGEHKLRRPIPRKNGPPPKPSKSNARPRQARLAPVVGMVMLATGLLVGGFVIALDRLRAGKPVVVRSVAPAPVDPIEHGTRLRQQLQQFAAAARLAKLCEDLESARTGSPAALDAFRNSWSERLRTTVDRSGLAAAIDAFLPVRDAFYQSESVGGADKSSLYGHVQDLIDLEEALDAAHVPARIGAVRLESPEFGPFDGPPDALLSGIALSLEPEHDHREILRMTQSSPSLRSAAHHAKMRGLANPRAVPEPQLVAVLLSNSVYTHPQLLSLPQTPGPGELRVVLSPLRPAIGVRVLTASGPSDPPGAWRLIGRVRPRSEYRHRVDLRLPPGVLPIGSFALRVELAYRSILPALGQAVDQMTRLHGFALGRRVVR